MVLGAFVRRSLQRRERDYSVNDAPVRSLTFLCSRNDHPAPSSAPLPGQGQREDPSVEADASVRARVVGSCRVVARALIAASR
jgi:hypothetical protein